MLPNYSPRYLTFVAHSPGYMKLFVNDKYINLVSPAHYTPGASYDVEISPAVPLSSVKLVGRVLIYGGTTAYIDALITLMEVKKLKKLDSVLFVTDQYDEVKAFVKAQFKIVKAGGGLVYKGSQMLMIFRLGLWDLPKGKLEKGEKTLAGALREVEEECNIQVVAEDKICSTWHTYVSDGRKILKKTSWYRMQCLNDADMRPQLEERIEDIRWMAKPQVQEALKHSYRSIIEVFVAEFSQERQQADYR